MNILNMTKKIAKNVIKKITSKKPEVTYSPADPKEDFFKGTDPVSTPAKPRGSMTFAYRSGYGWCVPEVAEEQPLSGDRMVMLADDGKVGSYVFSNGRWNPA